jgi:hypothetical protein
MEVLMRARMTVFIILFIAVSSVAFAIEAFRVKGVSLSVSEREYRGFCPHKFVFTGSITVNRAGTVRYTWLRNDGASSKTFRLDFDGPGTKPVTYEWELGGAMGSYPNRWVQLKVLAPNSLLSSRALFTLTCLPQARLERKAYKVSGRAIAGGAHVDWLAGLQLKFKLMNGTRVLSTCTAAFSRDGICLYSLILFNAPGTYRVVVEPVPPTDPDRFHLCFNSVDPALHFITLTEEAPEVTNKNFNLRWSWRHLDMNQEAFDSPCW